MKLMYLLALLAAPAVASAAGVTFTQRGGNAWTCVAPAPATTVLSTHSQQHKAEEACANRALADGRTYRAMGRIEIEIVPSGAVVVPPPSPVDCVVSAWAETAGAWSGCASGTRTRQITRTRSIVTQPTNGGQACPVLGETFPQSEACTVTPPPATGSAVLSWDPPSVWPGGAAITGALTYRLECGIGNFATQRSVSGRTYTLTGLASGLWQCRVYALQGSRVSDASNTVTKVIP